MKLYDLLVIAGGFSFIAFCGDWFDYEVYGRVEVEIRSGLSL